MIRAIWVDAELIGEHIHAKIHTGKQYNQDDVPSYDGGRGYRNDAGEVGTLILREDQWPSFIQALAVGGHATGLRVIWTLDRSRESLARKEGSTQCWDQRYLWNAHADAPAIVGEVEPKPWMVV